MKPKQIIEKMLRPFPFIYKIASKFYHSTNTSFDTLSPGTPEAIEKAFKYYKRNHSSEANELGYYEFGLFKGYTFFKAYEHAGNLGLNVKFYGFDSFEGLPEVEGVDKTGNRFFKGQFACTKDNVLNNLIENGVDKEKIELIEGYYDNSLTEQLHTEIQFKPAAVILLDCDLYSSTMVAMNWLKPYYQNGTVLLFDDWFSYGKDHNDDLGQPKALAEFLEQNPEYSVKELWDFLNHGKAFLLLKK